MAAARNGGPRWGQRALPRRAGAGSERPGPAEHPLAARRSRDGPHAERGARSARKRACKHGAPPAPGTPTRRFSRRVWHIVSSRVGAAALERVVQTQPVAHLVDQGGARAIPALQAGLGRGGWARGTVGLFRRGWRSIRAETPSCWQGPRRAGAPQMPQATGAKPARAARSRAVRHMTSRPPSACRCITYKSPRRLTGSSRGWGRRPGWWSS